MSDFYDFEDPLRTPDNPWGKYGDIPVRGGPFDGQRVRDLTGYRLHGAELRMDGGAYVLNTNWSRPPEAVCAWRAAPD